MQKLGELKLKHKKFLQKKIQNASFLTKLLEIIFLAQFA